MSTYTRQNCLTTTPPFSITLSDIVVRVVAAFNLRGVVIEASHELERAHPVAELRPAVDRAGCGEAVTLSITQAGKKERGGADFAIASHERDRISQTGRGDQFIRWIRGEIQSPQIQAHFGRDRPYMQMSQCSRQLRRVQTKPDPALRVELFDFPKHNRRDPPIRISL